ncbi:MAG TPA: CPBP family glutamic-type intramembrane protease [Caulobacteraceae bacterium]|jgi:membrane protease YdiL (CAAX protease family)
MDDGQRRRAPARSAGLIAAAAAAAFGIPWIASRVTAPLAGHDLARVLAHHTVQAALSLVVIAAIKVIGGGFDFGLRLPRGRADIGRAVASSLVVAALFTLVRYVPNIIAGQPPAPDHPLSVGSIAGWGLFEGVYVGPTEEVLFRSLAIGLLAQAALPALRIRRLEISGATLVAALLFAAAHFQAIGAAPWYVAVFQMTYAFVLGALYGYWFEKSRSLLVPALAHNATDLFATLVSFGVGAVWR